MQIGQVLKIKGNDFEIVDASKHGFLDSKLGSGLTADVYLAVAKPGFPEQGSNLPEKLVIKVQRQGINAELKRRFRSEGENLYTFQAKEIEYQSVKEFIGDRSMQHSPVLYEDRSSDEQAFLSLELVTGESVFERLAIAKTYAEPLALEIAEQLLWILYVLHTGVLRTFDDLQLKDLYWYPNQKLLKVIDWNVLSNRKTEATLKPGPDIALAAVYLLQLMSGTALTLDRQNQGVSRRELEKIERWEQISPITREIIARALHPREQQRYQSADQFRQALLERLQVWDQTSAVNLEKAKSLIGEADDLNNSNHAKIIELGQHAYDLAFLAAHKSDHNPVELKFVETYSNEHRIHGVSFFESARRFFQISDYENAQSSINLALEAGWGLEALRLRQAIILGINLKEKLREPRARLIAGLQAMQERKWKQAKDGIAPIYVALQQPLEILPLINELEIRILLAKAAELEESCLVADDPGVQLEQVAMHIDDSIRKLNEIEDDRYRTDIMVEIGDLSERSATLSRRVAQWKRFASDYQIVQQGIAGMQVNGVTNKLQSILLNPDASLEPLQQTRLLQIIRTSGLRWLELEEYEKANRLLGVAVGLPWNRVDGLENLQSAYRAADLTFQAWQALQEQRPLAARQYLSAANGFLNTDERKTTKIHFCSAVLSQLTAAQGSEAERLVEWLAEDLASTSPEIMERMKALEAGRHRELARQFESIKVQMQELRGKATVDELRNVEHYLRIQLAEQATQMTLAQDIAKLLGSIIDERKKEENRMETINVQGRWMDELNAHTIKCNSANTQEELEQAAVEFERFYKEWKGGDQDPKFQARIRSIISQNGIWLREWNTRLAEQKRLLEALEASKKMERYLNTASRKRLLSEVKTFLNRNPLRPGSQGMRDLRENAKQCADRWLFQMDFEDNQPASIKKAPFIATKWIIGLTALIGLLVGAGLFFGAFSMGLFDFGTVPATETLITDVPATKVPATEPSSATEVPTEVAMTPVLSDLGIKYSSQDARLAAQDALLDDTQKRVLWDPKTQKPYYLFAVSLPDEIIVIPDISKVKANGIAYVMLNGAVKSEKTIELVVSGEGVWNLKITDPTLLQANAMNTLELVFLDPQDHLISDRLYIFWAPTVTAVVENIDGVKIRDAAGSQNGETVLPQDSKVQVNAWTKVESNLGHPVWYQLVDGSWITATFTALDIGSPLVDGSVLTLPRFEKDLKRNIPYLEAILPYIP